MDWNDTKAIMLEVEALFSRGDDLRDIEDVKKMQQEVEIQYSQTLRDARDIIKGNVAYKFTSLYLLYSTLFLIL